MREKRSIDEIVGHLYSTSYASRAVLGDRVQAFERDVRERLTRLAPDGRFEKSVSTR